ncbi:hypothetical protein FOXG_14165 [Fusarium oxysporum f. sp. lycopersici 4287]|uniref:Uncharacterized protein n=3 Tax=Fusarium oxysporum TaxID=5507 RepID=A0A0J9VYC7_FUSO4|nr:hypothetical protein FOXG_14165 [Fusarium oxysporum f. sp. lycopersici 4287]KNB15761.1 hypothetical protein FOXG_14165 [Fusarium oxysporum f. sp. lycopersici 4287]
MGNNIHSSVSAIEQRKVQGDGKGMYKKSNDDWVARILEIRVSDEHHVYAPVYWMQRPEELLAGMPDGKKTVQGCPPYYSANEVIASDYFRVATKTAATMEAMEAMEAMKAMRIGWAGAWNILLGSLYRMLLVEPIDPTASVSWLLQDGMVGVEAEGDIL